VTAQQRAIDEAHAILSDPERRLAYDESLTAPGQATLAPVEEAAVVPSSPAGPLDELPLKTRKHLDPQLYDGEEPIAVIKGASSQAIVAFPTRLFVVKPGLMAGATFGARVTSFDYRNITAIEVNKKWATAVIEVIAPGYQGTMPTHFFSTKEGQDPYKISNCLPIGRADADKAEPKLALIRQQINALHSPAGHQPPAQTNGVADELSKLADLRHQGVLSEDEFAAAKARLLSA
jgi:hypothetical protein